MLALSGAKAGDVFAQSIPHSSGIDRPRLTVPANACDCHHHIYDPARFPAPADATAAMQQNARLEEYRRLQQRLGTTRSVVVTPGAYLTDNRVTLDALATLAGRARGVAVVRPDISDAELKTMDAGGIRGIRFSLTTATARTVTIDAPTLVAIEQMSKRAADLGWHLQFNVSADQIVFAESLWSRLPSTIVFDHMGHIPQPAGTRHPAFVILRRMLDTGRTWIKLSVTYDSSAIGPPTYADVNTVGRAYVVAAPERLVWGSNWPHPNETVKPNDARLIDLLAEWAPDEGTRHRILVENPARLYRFT